MINDEEIEAEYLETVSALEDVAALERVPANERVKAEPRFDYLDIDAEAAELEQSDNFKLPNAEAATSENKNATAATSKNSTSGKPEDKNATTGKPEEAANSTAPLEAGVKPESDYNYDDYADTPTKKDDALTPAKVDKIIDLMNSLNKMFGENKVFHKIVLTSKNNTVTIQQVKTHNPDHSKYRTVIAWI